MSMKSPLRCTAIGAVRAREVHADPLCTVCLKLSSRGCTPVSCAACAMSRRIKLYASKYTHSSFWIMDGLLQLSVSIPKVVLMQLRSSSMFHRCWYSSASSRLVALRGSSSVLSDQAATTTLFARFTKFYMSTMHTYIPASHTMCTRARVLRIAPSGALRRKRETEMKCS